MLTGTIAKDLRELLKLKAKQLDIEIEDMKVMPDHVRLFENSCLHEKHVIYAL